MLLLSLVLVGCVAAESSLNQETANSSPTIAPAVLLNTASLPAPTQTTTRALEGEIKNGASGSSTVKLGSGTFSVTASNSGTHYDVNKQTALGALIASGKSITITDSYYSEYGSLFVTSINGKAGAGSKGWMYQVNSATPSVGANAYPVSDGDSVVWYWSEGMSSTPATSSQTIWLTVSTASSTPTQAPTTVSTQIPRTVTTTATAKAPTTVATTVPKTIVTASGVTSSSPVVTPASANPTATAASMTTSGSSNTAATGLSATPITTGGSTTAAPGVSATPITAGSTSTATTGQVTALVASNNTGTSAQAGTVISTGSNGGTTTSSPAQSSYDSSSGTSGDLVTLTTLATSPTLTITANTTMNTTISTTAPIQAVTSDEANNTTPSTSTVTTVESTGVMTPTQTTTHKSPGPSGLVVMMVVLGALLVSSYRKRE